jgi:hypothetical protein
MSNKTRAAGGQILTNTRTSRRLAIRDKAAFDRRITPAVNLRSGQVGIRGIFFLIVSSYVSERSQTREQNPSQRRSVATIFAPAHNN